MYELGPFETILGIRIIRDRKNRTLTLSQERYIDVVFKKFKFGVDAFIMIVILI